jgi:hypothetical protein
MRSHYLEYIMIILLYVQYDHPYIVRSILIEQFGGKLGPMLQIIQESTRNSRRGGHTHAWA